MSEESREIVEKREASGLDKYDVEQLVGYIMGEEVEPPEQLSKMMTNLFSKLTVGLGYSVANNVQRQAKLAKFVAKAEESLFDDSEVDAMDVEDLKEKYVSAQKVLNELNEFERRFIAQNKGAFDKVQTDQEKIAQQLMSLSPDKLQAVMNIINGEAQMEKEQEEEDIFEDSTDI